MTHKQEEIFNRSNKSSWRTYIKCIICKKKSVLKCRACRRIFYCCREHQRLDWKRHKYECHYHRILSNQNTPQVNDVRSRIQETVSQCFIDATLLKCYEDLVNCLISSLTSYGICVVDNYIHHHLVEQMLQEVVALCTTEQPHYGERERQTQYRSDKVRWVNGTEKLCSKLQLLIRSFDSLVRSFTSNDFPAKAGPGLVTRKSNMQLSYFPPASFGYKRHIDNPNNNGRVITSVFYLNQGYNRDRDGGVTRFYLSNNTKYVDVEPKFNRAVFYWSDSRTMLETLPCQRGMYSLTTWYMNDVRQRTNRTTPVSDKNIRVNDLPSELPTRTSIVRPPTTSRQIESSNTLNISNSKTEKNSFRRDSFTKSISKTAERWPFPPLSWYVPCRLFCNFKEAQRTQQYVTGTKGSAS